MRTISLCVASIPAIALIAAACGQAGPSADDLNKSGAPSVGGSAGGTATGGTTQMAGSGPSAGSGGAGVAGSSGPSAGTAGSDPAPMGGSAGSTPATGGSGGTSAGAGGSSGGSGGSGETGPYAPRSGSFKMLVYSQTRAFRHDGSIASGKQLLQQIATEQGFQVTITENNNDITAAGLAQYEIVFFMNPTGDIFAEAQEAAFEEWMRNGGAFAGVHSATDTEQGWAFYKEVTGQYYNGHGPANTAGSIQFEASMLEHPALKGIQNPWQRNEEWYRFDTFTQWSAQPGFKILGRKQADNQPIMWIREWGNFRAFYTAIGHDAVVFQNDANVKRHLTGGIMWAVRREHLIR